MQRRLLLIVLVFVVFFGIGYGITWLLVGSAARDGEKADTKGNAATVQPPRDPVPVATAPDASADSTSTIEVEEVAAPDAVAVAADTAVASPEVAPDTAADAAQKAAWEACVGHACRIDFGKVTGGISIRKGSLTNGQAVDWDRDFAKADKIGTLEAGPDVKVEVIAVGLVGAEPAAAYIRKKTRRDELEGVIALRIGDKALRLVVIEE